jgi:AraC-like DNA-binding protein
MGGTHDRASGTLAAASAAAGGVQPGHDALSDVLEVVRLSGALFFVVRGSPPWIAEAPESVALAPVILPRVQHVVSYHVIVEGSCWCRLGRAAPLQLDAGSVIVVPHGDAYALSSAPGLSSGLSHGQMLDWFRQMAAGELPFVVEEGAGEAASLTVVCGFLGCDASPFNPVLGALPKLLHLRRQPDRERDSLDTLADLIVAESRVRQAGSRSVLLRIGELMFVEVVRRHLAAVSGEDGGWLAGLRDPLVGRVLEQMHREPHRDWTLDELARETATSRSVLAERFAHLVGEPPMHYLTRWRLQRAARLLDDGAGKVSAVAEAVGYASEAAFSRAFKKHTGVAPSVWRDR